MDDTLRTVLQVVGIVAPVIALVTYRRNVRTRRAEWLSALHAKFFESGTYKRIRHILDYEPPELVTLRECIAGGGSDELVESFVDYLNFFEFIASLKKLGQLSLTEIAMLFEYYLNSLASKEFVVDFVRNNGFENLAELFDELKQRRGRR